MSAVIDGRARAGWLTTLWDEHRGWTITFALLVVSLLVWKIHGAETVRPVTIPTFIQDRKPSVVAIDCTL